jgi:hypothetical protein
MAFVQAYDYATTPGEEHPLLFVPFSLSWKKMTICQDRLGTSTDTPRGLI